MLEFISGLHPVTQGLIGTAFTYLMNTLGAAMVIFTRRIRQNWLDAMLGFAGGVMIAASAWGLLTPAFEMEQESGRPVWWTIPTAFLIGGLVIWLIHTILPHAHKDADGDRVEGMSASWKRTTLLIVAITIHNIPEGIAVGVAFGAAAAGAPGASIAGAAALALGIGIQNFPEGMAVALPLRREGMSIFRSFWYGQLSGIVEPLGGIFGAWLVFSSQAILPYALAFAAGAMIFVVLQEVVPESQAHGNSGYATTGGMIGFALMMVLDLTLG
ncbi:MAG: ZIP family metal transporter [Leptospiraceae bacterium]|nr:ZIP family metal transporter [Leptospiraceae bacterium]MCB1321459.1 ZIP family metal transporter [Leptospiraceae bacterium]